MKLKILLTYFILLIVLFTYSCKEDLVGSDLIDTSVYSYLPVKPGNYWIYNFNTPAEIAIIKREIKNKLTHEDGSLIYGFTEEVVVNNPNPNEPIVGYYSPKEGAIFYYSSSNDTMFPGTSILCKKIPFIKTPLTIGASWIVVNDTFNVAAFPSIVVNEQTYDKTILIVSKRDNFIDSTWFSKDVGIVRKKSIVADSFTEWNLKSYSIQ